MRIEKTPEPWVVAIDDLYGNFELVSWYETREDAERFYTDLGNADEFPDKEGRNKHLFKMIRTTGPDLGVLIKR